MLRLTSLVFILTVFVHAQHKEWDYATNEDGTVSVKSIISERIDEQGDEHQLIEFIAQTTDSLNVKNCIKILKDINMHLKFAADEGKMLKTISENEWIIYYFFDAPWPFPNSEAVLRMKMVEDKINNEVVFYLTAAPNEMEDTGTDRMAYYEESYTFRIIGKHRVEIILHSKVSPTFSVPNWMLGGLFPDGPAETLKEIVSLAKKLEH